MTSIRRGGGGANPFHPLNVGQAVYAGQLADLLERSSGQPAQGLSPSGTYTRGNVTYNPNYYAKLIAAGHTIDPSTGHRIPGAPLGAGQFDRASAQLEDMLLGVTRTKEGEPVDVGLVGAINRQQAANNADTRRQMIATGLMSESELLPSPTQREFGEAMAPHNKARARKAASDYAATVKAMGQPGVMRSDVESMQRQFAEKYPEYANGPPEPMSPQQIAQLEKRIAVEERRDTIESSGLPRNLLVDLDEKGKPVWSVTPDQYFRSQYEQRRAEVEETREERAYYKDLRDQHLKTKPEPPDLLKSRDNPNAAAEYESSLRVWERELSEYNKRATGFDGQSAVRAQQQAQPKQTPAERAVQEGVPFVRVESPDSVREQLASWEPGTIIEHAGRSYRVTGGDPPLAPIQ